MFKFLRITLSDAPHLIPVDKIIGVEVGVDTKINVFVGVGHTATGASEAIGYEIVATTAADAAKTKEQLTDFVNQLGEAASSHFTKPIYDLDLKYAVTAVNQIEVEFSA